MYGSTESTGRNESDLLSSSNNFLVDFSFKGIAFCFLSLGILVTVVAAVVSGVAVGGVGVSAGGVVVVVVVSVVCARVDVGAFQRMMVDGFYHSSPYFFRQMLQRTWHYPFLSS